MSALSILPVKTKLPTLDDEGDGVIPEPAAVLVPAGHVRPVGTAGHVRPVGIAPSPPAPAPLVDAAPEADSLASVDVLAKHMILQHTQRTRVTAALASAQQYAERNGMDLESLSAQLLPLGVDVHRLSRELGCIQKGLAECASDKGWTLVTDGDLRLLYQHEPGTHVHSFKGSACLDAPIEQPLCLAREFDLVSTWNRHMEETIILKESGAAELWVYCAVWLPWPFASRDMVIHAQGIDLLEEQGCIAVAFEACDDNLPEGVTLPAAAAKRERIKVLPGSVMRLEPVPLGGGKRTANGHTHMTRGTAVSHIDANMPYVPSAIIQFVLRVFAPFMYHQVLRIVKKSFRDASSPLPSRMRQRPELYSMVAEQVAAFMASTQGPAT